MASDSGRTTTLNVTRAPSHELPCVNGAGSYIALIIGILTQVDPRRNIGNCLECHIDPPLGYVKSSTQKCFGKGDRIWHSSPEEETSIDFPMMLPTNCHNTTQRVEWAFLEPANIQHVSKNASGQSKKQ